MLKKLLFQIAKSPLMGAFVGNAFRFLSSFIPVERAFSSEKVIAFYHPQPCYKNHLLLSPKKAIRNLQALASDVSYFETVFQAAQHLSATLPQYHNSFTLVANGGKRQEVQQVHFHMFTDHEMVNVCNIQEPASNGFYRDKNISILPHPSPDWEIHFVLQPSTEHPQDYFKSVLQSINQLNAEYGIVSKGYSLVYQHIANTADAYPVFHIISGKKLN